MTRPEDLQAGNPGLSDTAAQFGLRRAREIYEIHRDPPHGLKLAEVQLAAIIAGAFEDGVYAEYGCHLAHHEDGNYTLFPATAGQSTPSRIVPASLAPHVDGLLPEGGEE